jgi:hypothetical protein
VALRCHFLPVPVTVMVALAVPVAPGGSSTQIRSRPRAGTRRGRTPSPSRIPKALEPPAARRAIGTSLQWTWDSGVTADLLTVTDSNSVELNARPNHAGRGPGCGHSGWSQPLYRRRVKFRQLPVTARLDSYGEFMCQCLVKNTAHKRHAHKVVTTKQ